MVTLTLIEGSAKLSLVVLNFLIWLSRRRKLIALQVISVRLNVWSLSMCIQTSRLTRGTVRIHLLFVKHLDFLGIFHVNCRIIMLSLLLALCVIIPGRILLLLTSIVRLFPHSLSTIKVLCILRLLRRPSFFVNWLWRVLRILALVYTVVDHGVIISFPLSVLDSWSHWHGWKMNTVAIFGLNLWHAAFHLIYLGIICWSMARLNVAVIPTTPWWVLLLAWRHKLLLVLFLQLLGWWELTVVVNRTSSYTHYTVYVNWTVSIIHGVTFSSIHNIAILWLSGLSTCNSRNATDSIPWARHFNHLWRACRFFKTNVSKWAASTSCSSATHIGRGIELLSSGLLLTLL